MAQKSGSDGPAVREHARHIAHARQADLPWPLTKAAPKPLLHVQEVIWHGDKSRPVSLLDYLLDLPWKRTYWKEMARHKSHAEAAFEARKRHGSLTDQDDGRKQDYSRAVTKQFGPVAVAWALAGECLHDLGGRLSLIDAQLDPRYKEFSSSTGAQLVAFATKYGPVLSRRSYPPCSTGFTDQRGTSPAHERTALPRCSPALAPRAAGPDRARHRARCPLAAVTASGGPQSYLA